MRESSLIWHYWRIRIAPASMVMYDPSLYIVRGWAKLCTEGSTAQSDHPRRTNLLIGLRTRK